MKITPAQQFAFTQAFILKKLGEIQQKLSSHMLMRTDLKEKLTKSVVTTSKSQWVSPSFASLHWDSKILQSHNSKYVNKTSPVVAMGSRDEVKLLVLHYLPLALMAKLEKL